jgi:hypothetical protein
VHRARVVRIEIGGAVIDARRARRQRRGDGAARPPVTDTHTKGGIRTMAKKTAKAGKKKTAKKK